NYTTFRMSATNLEEERREDKNLPYKLSIRIPTNPQTYKPDFEERRREEERREKGIAVIKLHKLNSKKACYHEPRKEE
ncbi:19103_t:CDS:2, partial [Dentiscutata erythropus]